MSSNPQTRTQRTHPDVGTDLAEGAGMSGASNTPVQLDYATGSTTLTDYARVLRWLVPTVCVAVALTTASTGVVNVVPVLIAIFSGQRLEYMVLGRGFALVQFLSGVAPIIATPIWLLAIKPSWVTQISVKMRLVVGSAAMLSLVEVATNVWIIVTSLSVYLAAWDFNRIIFMAMTGASILGMIAVVLAGCGIVLFKSEARRTVFIVSCIGLGQAISHAKGLAAFLIIYTHSVVSSQATTPIRITTLMLDLACLTLTSTVVIVCWICRSRVRPSAVLVRRLTLATAIAGSLALLMAALWLVIHLDPATFWGNWQIAPHMLGLAATALFLFAFCRATWEVRD
jgi:hypothetical protein